MDPPTLINQGASYHLSEIWNYPISGGGAGEAGGGLELRGGHFGPNLGHFGDNAGAGGVNREASCGGDDPMILERSGGRKRRDAATDDEAGKAVSTSGGGNVAVFVDSSEFGTLFELSCRILDGFIFLSSICFCFSYQIPFFCLFIYLYFSNMDEEKLSSSL